MDPDALLPMRWGLGEVSSSSMGQLLVITETESPGRGGKAISWGLGGGLVHKLPTGKWMVGELRTASYVVALRHSYFQVLFDLRQSSISLGDQPAMLGYLLWAFLLSEGVLALLGEPLHAGRAGDSLQRRAEVVVVVNEPIISRGDEFHRAAVAGPGDD